MGTLNEIPEYVREPEKNEWTPGRGLLKGAMFTVLTAVVLGAVLSVLTYYAPPLTTRLFLAFVWGFVVTWMLFAVMHRAAGMVSGLCTAIVVICALLVFIAKHFALFMYTADLQGGTVSLWSMFEPAAIVAGNLAPFFGLVMATFMCHGGDSILLEIADRVTANPFSGRRR